MSATLMADKDSTMGAIASEMKSNPPAIINATRRKFGVARAEKQRKAILLSKGRQAGVKLPKATMSGGSKSSGGY